MAHVLSLSVTPESMKLPLINERKNEWKCIRISLKNVEIVYDHRYYCTQTTEPTNHSFLHYKDHYLHLPNILCMWATNIDITRSQEILLQRRETAAKENAGEGIAARI